MFPSKAKIAAVLPFFKKDDRLNKNNYRPISVLSVISKIFEKILKRQIMEYKNNILSPLISAYRKNYSTQHVLIRLLEEWRKGLDDGNLVGAILMDLSKAFDCIPHDLLIAKLHAYGFNANSLSYIYGYLKGRRQGVKINGIYSNFLTLLAGVPQGSILGPILFNIFINDFYYLLHDASLHGFADDHTISANSKTLQNLTNILSKETNIAIDWLQNNSMIANPSKFQAIIFSKSKEPIITNFHIKDRVIKSQEYVQLLGVTFDYKLDFSLHIKDICRKASGQLNALFRLKQYLCKESRYIAVNSFILSNFHYCPLIWHFSTYDSAMKLEKLYQRSFNFINNNEKVHDVSISMQITRLRIFAIEIYKTLHNLNPSYMKDIFQISNFRHSNRLKYNIQTHSYAHIKYGRKSLRFLGPMLWNSLPNEAKCLDTLSKFKSFMKGWGTDTCPHFKRFVSYNSSV